MSFVIVVYSLSLIACSIAGTVAFQQEDKVALCLFCLGVGLNIPFLITLITTL